MIDVRRGDVVDIDFEPARGHEIGKTRPAVVVQNDIGNQYSPLIIVVPIRGAEHIKRLYPVIVPIQLFNQPSVPFSESDTIKEDKCPSFQRRTTGVRKFKAFGSKADTTHYTDWE